MHRREAMGALAAFGLGCVYPGQAAAATVGSSTGTGTSIQIVQPKVQTIPGTARERKNFEYRIGRAVLELIQDWYGQGDLPVWNRALADIDMEKRVVNIVYWVMRFIPDHEEVYPVDPVWIMAQMMEESFYYEFAVSWAFAVGICQFMSVTARSVGMVCPENSDLKQSELNKPELASALTQLQGLQKQRTELINSDPTLFKDPQSKLQEILKVLAAGGGNLEPELDLSRLEQLDALDRRIKEARSSYRSFLQANYENRSIFNPQDVRFFYRFDQRVTYRKPVQGMIQIMAENLRARNGNILAATAAYNAGLSRTYTERSGYASYGRIPPVQETVGYLSRIVVAHHEMSKRIQ